MNINKQAKDTTRQSSETTKTLTQNRHCLVVMRVQRHQLRANLTLIYTRVFSLSCLGFVNSSKGQIYENHQLVKCQKYPSKQKLLAVLVLHLQRPRQHSSSSFFLMVLIECSIGYYASPLILTHLHYSRKPLSQMYVNENLVHFWLHV